MAQRDNKKRLGKKHRQASTRPKKGRAPRVAPTTGATLGAQAPRKRKAIAAKRAEQEKKKRTPTRSPENENRKTVAQNPSTSRKTIAPRSEGRAVAPRISRTPANEIVGRQTPRSANIGKEDDWRDAELLAAQMHTAAPGRLSTDSPQPATRNLPLIAICGRPNVGKSTLFNRLTGSRRSIVGDEPGITRDRIYGEIEWQGRDARLVDTGGVIPDDLALIPTEIFRQAQVALSEATAIIMVVDGRTELASPDLELARLLLRGGKPTFLAVNKMDTEALQPQAENFRRLGFRNVLPISAEHGSGIGDLLDEVFSALPPEASAALPQSPVISTEAQRSGETPASPTSPATTFLTTADEIEEDETGPDFTGPLLTEPAASSLTTDHSPLTTEDRPRRLRSHGSFDQRETRVAIIGRPNVGKSTLLNALTGTDRAIVSPIAGTTRDAVDEVVERGNHAFRFVDTAGIRRKGKTHLMAEKLSVIMARKHLEAADVSLLVLDATEGVTALDANIGGYAHESGRSVIIVVNKWDLISNPSSNNPATNSNPNTNNSAGHKTPGAPSIAASSDGWDRKKSISPNSTPKVDQNIYEQQVRDHLKYLEYAPLVFLSAASGKGIEGLFKKIELIARERRKRITTGQMNRFLERVDFQKASVPMNRRVRIYYMTQAAVAPPTFVLFTDKDVKLHFAFERFLANQIRETFGFIGSPIWFKTKPRNKKKPEE